MRKRQGIWILAVFALALGAARAQDTTVPSSDSNGQEGQPQQSSPQQPVPGNSGGTSAPPFEENPPISGLDQPGLEPHGAPLSYLQPGATFSESVDSNIENSTSGQAVHSISRGLGSLELQRLWSHYDLAVQYIGGVAYYNQKDLGWKALQQMDLEQKITWKRGQLALRDSFSYLPEGNFGASYGSLGSQGISSLGSTAFGGFLGGSNLGTLGLVPRITNISVADVSESLTPKSAVTAAGGYAVTHFYGTETLVNQTVALLNNTQVSAQAGYNRILSPRTQVAMVYGYQGFDFGSFGTAFHSHVIMGMYGHRISGKMDFLIGAGPQITNLTFLGFPDRRIGVAGRMRLRYQFTRTSVDLSYQRFETAGSGLFAGAQTDLVVLSAEHRLTRVWNLNADLGYSRNSRLVQLTSGQLATCNSGGINQVNKPPCPVNANTYIYGFAGLALHRAFGHNFHGFVSYQFNELSFDNSYCAGLPVCSRIGNRSVGTIGLDWIPRPIRID